jgi:uncharacterized membrane protein YdjX (TVP38/TMEM64 family)
VALDQILLHGAEAYRHGDFSAAAAAFEEASQTAPSSEATMLCAALRDLSQAFCSPVPPGGAPGELLSQVRRQLNRLPPRTLGLDLHDLQRQLDGPPMAGPPDLRPCRRSSRAAIARFLLFIALLGAAFIAVRWTPLSQYMERDALVAALAELRGAWWSPLALIALYAVVSPLGAPISPVVVAGGAVFGTLWGTIYNIAGLFVGAGMSYFLALSLGRDFLVQFGGHRLRQAERLLKRQGFWTLARVRFLPIPFPVVNFGAALAGVPLPLFLSSSAVGLVPACWVWTYLAASLSTAAADQRRAVLMQVAVAIVLLLALSFLPTLWLRISRRRRYRRLLEGRRRRTASRR